MSDEGDVCQCRLCREYRAGVGRVVEPEDEDSLDDWIDQDDGDLLGDDEEEDSTPENGSGGWLVGDDGKEGDDMARRQREEQFPERLYVERSTEEDREGEEIEYFTANTAIDLLDDGGLVGVYQLVEVKTVKRTVTLE